MGRKINLLRSRVKGMLQRRTKAASRQMYPHLRPQNSSEKKRVIWIIVLLLGSIEIPEFTTYFSYYKPSILKEQSDWFLLSSYHLKMYQYYYYKFTCDRLAVILRMIAFAKTAVQYSTVVFLASFIILCHVIVDLFLFWLNNNTWPMFYAFEIVFLYTIIRGLIRPYSPESFARIRSIF